MTCRTDTLLVLRVTIVLVLGLVLDWVHSFSGYVVVLDSRCMALAPCPAYPASRFIWSVDSQTLVGHMVVSLI